MAGNESVNELGDGSDSWDVLVGANRKSRRPERKDLEDGTRALVDSAIDLNEMNGVLEMIPREVGKTRGNLGILKRDIRQSIAETLAPTCEPMPTETAVAVVNQNGLRAPDSSSHGVRPHFSLSPSALGEKWGLTPSIPALRRARRDRCRAALG
jgi:hypothetical protein